MQVYKNFVLANEYQSSKLCEALYTMCEEKMDQLQVLRLPSMAKFNAGFLQCNQSFERECVGPSKSNYEMRMMKVCDDHFGHSICVVIILNFCPLDSRCTGGRCESIKWATIVDLKYLVLECRDSDGKWKQDNGA